MRFLENGSSSMELSKIENGFLADRGSECRWLTINLIFRSAVHPEISMICEVRLCLQQLLREGERLEEVEHILREERLFCLVNGEEMEGTTKGVDLRMPSSNRYSTSKR